MSGLRFSVPTVVSQRMKEEGPSLYSLKVFFQLLQAKLRAEQYFGIYWSKRGQDPLRHYERMRNKAGSSVSCVKLVLRRPWQRQNGSASSESYG